MTNEQLEVLKKYGIDKEYIYEDESKIINKYMYISGFIFIELFDISEEFFEFMQINKMIAERKKYIERMFKERNFGGILAMIPKPYRMDYYELLYKFMDNKERYELFIDVYSSMEYGFNQIDKDFLKEVLSLNPNKSYDFPNEVTIYRGEGDKSTPIEDAFSWTLSIDTAKWFAKRLGSEGKLYKAKVKKENILCYIEDRGEHEVLALYDDIYDIEQIE